MNGADLFGMRIDATSYEQATAQVIEWAQASQSRMVAHANVHMLMLAQEDAGLRTSLNSADLVTPDGMPLVWLLRSRGFADQSRVYGPTMMMHVLAEAAKRGLPVGFYGGRHHVLELLTSRLCAQFPSLQIAYAQSPPFSDSVEDATADQAIFAAGVRLLFVGLGCPKQERWMAARQGKLPAVMLGVGAAFDFHAGQVKQAPELLQRAGLEWAFRLAMEPRRLASRYLRHNPKFVRLLLRDWLETRARR